MNNHLRISEEKDLPVKQLDALFRAIGWKPRGKERWREVLTKSSYIVSLWDKENLIGLGRILEDGIMCMFYDVGVHPNYQTKGIGTLIMKKLTNYVKNRKYASIGLFVWDKNYNAEDFYKKFGFEKVETGMELIKYMQKE